MDQVDHHRAVKEHGYTVVRGALTVEEVGRLRFALHRYMEQPGAARYVYGGRVKNNPFAFEPDEMGILLGHPRLASVLKSISGGQIKFARELGLAENLKSGWHKDMRGLDSSVEDGEHAPGVFKILLYLQDHIGLDGSDFALKVRRGSHLIADTESGPEETIFTRAGDAIIMDCRITHRGQDSSAASIFTRAATEGLRRLAGPRMEYHVTRRVRGLFGRADRQLVTVLYGRCNHWTDAFMRNSRETEQRRIPDLPTDPPLPSTWAEAFQSVEIGF